MQKTKVAIIGSGPAGYTAALYTARAGFQPLVFAGEKSGGQLMNTTEIENYPGFPEGKDGPQLMFDMRAQAEKFGAQVMDQYVTAVDFASGNPSSENPAAGPFKLWTNLPATSDVGAGEILEKGSDEEIAQFIAEVKKTEHAVEAEAVIVTVGSQSKPLNVPGEKEFLGRGVSTCAVCDAAFFRDKNTIVVGGGDTAMEDSLALTKFAKTVTILVRGDTLRASKVMQERLKANPKVTFLYNTCIDEIHGDAAAKAFAVKEVLLGDTSDPAQRKQKTMPVDGVFVAIGHQPMTKIFTNEIQLDAHGFIVTRQSLSQVGLELAQKALTPEGLIQYPTTTSVEGIFAAGDVVDIRYWQAVTAAGQGCSAAIDAERWLEKR